MFLKFSICKEIVRCILILYQQAYFSHVVLNTFAVKGELSKFHSAVSERLHSLII